MSCRNSHSCFIVQEMNYNTDLLKDGELYSKTNCQWFSVKLKYSIEWGFARVHLVLFNTFCNDLDKEI